MATNPDDVVRAAAGPLVQIEMWQAALSEAGIDSKVVGTDLTPSFGTALQDSIELWVHRSDLTRAEAAIRDAEARRKDGLPGVGPLD